MNYKNLNMVFERYIEKFEWLNQKPEPDEGYKWVVVQEFQDVFNLDVPDDEFASMLYKAWKASANLIDSNQQQPFYALVEYARREPAKVRTMFKELLSDDGGDLNLRQRRITNFLADADELLQKYFPSSHLYINNQRSVMAYQWFYNPDKYYYYKATEAKYLADCVEFYDDWGTYSSFQLDTYYRFCDELIAHINTHQALLDTHHSRFENQTDMHPDKNLHILIVDIIFCAKRYGLYDGIPVKDSSAPAKRLYLERKAKAAELLAALETCEQNVALLEEARTMFTSLVQNGAPIVHKSYGVAELVELTDGMCILFFPERNEQKKFEFLRSLAMGFIRIDVTNFNELYIKYRNVTRNESSVYMLHESAAKALEPYREYLD